MNILLHLKQEWDVIIKAPFACVLCLVIGFAVGSWYYSERVATLDSQVSFWKDKATASGVQAAAAAAPATAPVSPAGATPSSGAGAHLTMNAEGASFYVSPSDESLTGIVLDVQIKNSGLPSIATAWKLRVSPKRGDPVMAQFSQIPKQLVVQGSPPVIVRASEGLWIQVLDKPANAEGGFRKNAILRAPAALNAVQDAGTMLRLSVQDITGNPFFTEQLVGDWLHPHGDAAQ